MRERTEGDGNRLLRRKEGGRQGEVSPPVADPHQGGAARRVGGAARREEGSTPGLGVEARGQPRPRPPSRRRAKARRSGGSLARGAEWRGRWTGRSGFAVVGGDRRGSTEGGGSDGASSPAADSAKREAGGGRPRPARRRRHPGEFITICCCSTTTAADQIDLPRHLEDQQILDLPWRGWRARPPAEIDISPGGI